MRLRSPKPDEARDVLDLIVARDIADLGRPDYTLEDVENDWASPSVDLQRDAWLAVGDGGALLGYALLDDRGAALITVPPASEGRGVGTALREAAETRALERGEALCRQFVPSGNERARALLLDAGYWPAHIYFRLARDLTDLPPTPTEVAVRQFSRGIDDVAVHALIDEAFASIPGNMAQTLESWQAAKIDKQGWDPSLWLVHEDASGLAAVVLGERWEEGTGYIDFLAVAPRVQEHRAASTRSRTAGSCAPSCRCRARTRARSRSTSRSGWARSRRPSAGRSRSAPCRGPRRRPWRG